MNTLTAPNKNNLLTAPLRVAPDMAASWNNVATDFDTAAHAIVQTHDKDGDATDLAVTDLSTWAATPKDGTISLAPLSGHREPLALRSTAFSNLMAKFGAPTEFVRDRLPAPLQLAVTNWLLARSERHLPATLRVRGDQVTAIVSDRYASLDNQELLACVRDALERHHALGDVEVRAMATGLVDVLRVVFPSRQAPIKVGDVSALGLDISSSCFGKSSVKVSGLVWRLRCTNGLRTAESAGTFNFRHVGDVDRLRACISDAIPTALIHARGTMDRWRASVNVMIQDVAALIDEMRELTISERRLVEERVRVEVGGASLVQSMPLYEILNGITSAAHEAAPARRLELESMAGNLLVRHTGDIS